MQTVKLCTYTRGFYPTVWGYRNYTILGIFIVIIDGKIIKRSFSELRYTKEGENLAEYEALRAGLIWISSNMNMGDTELQVLFCGADRAKCKKLMDANETMPVHDYEIRALIKCFPKVAYYSSARASENVNLYDMTNTIFELLYGDSGFNHVVIEDFVEDGITKKTLVGQPELRWRDGTPRTVWEWS